MESAKQAVNKFIGRSGQHDTEVDERVNPAVTQETVKPHRHEETVKAVDREVHQDHYHTTVQPLQHKEVLPERHSHQQMPVEEREYTHGDSSNIKASVEREASKFANTSTTHPTTHTTSQGAAVAGEHVHHHVHETVQPVVHKEVVQPEVVHTTVPVHETHHAQAEHHGISTLPVKTLSEFQSAGGKPTGQSHRHEEYEGHPRPYNPSMQQGGRSEADVNPASHDGIHGSHGTSSHHGHHHGSNVAGGQGLQSETTGSHGIGSGTAGTQGLQSETTGSHGIGSGTTGGLTGTSGSHVSGDRDIHDRTSGYGSTGHVGSTGTALGGRTEGNTASRAMGAAAGHDSTTVGSTHTSTHGVGSESTTGRGLGHSTTQHSTTSGTGTQHQNQHADTSSSTTRDRDTAAGTSSDKQHPSQGKDPSLVEANTSSANWKGQGAPGSHSAVFGLTPDGKQHDETSHGTTPLKSHPSDQRDDTTGETGSRASTGGRVADQMHDPRVAQKGHGGGMTSTGNEKPGAGAPGGEQGFGQIRSSEHGATSKMHDKLDPHTDADGDGKRGMMD